MYSDESYIIIFAVGILPDLSGLFRRFFITLHEAAKGDVFREKNNVVCIIRKLFCFHIWRMKFVRKIAIGFKDLEKMIKVIS